jgi:predicted nucleotidyltransferase
MSEEEELRRLISAITDYAVPKHIVLFGSRAKGLARSESDFDLCIIYDRLPKRSLEVMQDLYLSIFPITGHPVDLLVYQADQFNEKAVRSGTLESAIHAEGQVVYG